MLRRDNKIQFAIEQVINHPILAEFNGLSRHAVILVTKANQLVKNNRWVGIVDTDDDFPRAARGVMDFVINGRKALINGKQLLIQFLSGFIQTDVVIFAGKQRIADLILQCGNAFTERRCGHMYFFCRSGNVIGLRQQNEITHLFRDKNIHSVPLKIAMAYPHYGEKKTGCGVSFLQLLTEKTRLESRVCNDYWVLAGVAAGCPAVGSIWKTTST